MASQYFAIIFIVCAFCSIDDTGAASGPCPFPPDCRCRSPACRPPNPAKADEVKTPRIAEEPAVPNSLRSINDTDAASSSCPFPPLCRCPSPPCRPPNPAKADEVKTPRIAEEPAVPNSLRYAP